MARLTHGVLPRRADFDAAFERELGGRRYTIRSGLTALVRVDRTKGRRREYGLDGAYDADELWKLLQGLSKSRREESQSLAGDILGTLGFEWV